MCSHAITICCAAILLSGCASVIVPKDVPVTPAVQAQAKQEVSQEIGLQAAAYSEAQRFMSYPGWDCARRAYLPFYMATTGASSAANLDEERRAAYAKLGVDQFARIVWLAPDAPDTLKVGDKVEAIDGKGIDSGSESSFEEARLYATTKDPIDAPVSVKIAGRSEPISVHRTPGCAINLVSDFHTFNKTLTNATLRYVLLLPSTILSEAKTPADQMWLADFSFYLISSPEASSRRKAMAVGGGIAAVIGFPLEVLIPGFGPIGGTLLRKTQLNATFGMTAHAIEFATREAYARGDDPVAELGVYQRLVAQAKRANSSVGIFGITDAEMKRVELVARSLKETGTAPTPDYDTGSSTNTNADGVVHKNNTPEAGGA